MTKVLALTALLAACSHPDEFTDAGPGADAIPDDGGGSTDVVVHVTTVDGTGLPDTAAAVYFASADGAVLDTVTPDADGRAIGTIDPGGSVTVRFGVTAYTVMQTILGAQPGDELWFGRPAGPTTGAPGAEGVAETIATITGFPEDEVQRSAVALYAVGGQTAQNLEGTITDGDPATATFTAPPDVDDAITALITTYTPTVGHMLAVHASPRPATLAIDVTPRAPLLVADAGGDGTIRWATARPGTADAIVADTEEVGPDDEIVASWTLLAPPDTDEIGFPAVPDAPRTHLASLATIEIDVLDDYADLRPYACTGDWRGPGGGPDHYVESHVFTY